MSKAPSARAGQAPHPDDPTPERTIRVWGLVYVNFEDGPGGGFQLHEAVLPLAMIGKYTVRTWPPELLSVVMPRLAGRAQTFAADGEDAERGTYG